MTPNYWLNLQMYYDLVMAETELENTLAKVLTLKDIKKDTAHT
jgi:antitoxin HigA-1